MQNQNDVASASKVEPCDICGDVGFSELIVTCSECKINREHRYCTRVHYIKEVPEVWFCEPCESKNATTSPCNVNQEIQAPKKQQTARTGKVKFIDEGEVIKLASSSFSMTRKAYFGVKKVAPKIPSGAVKSNPCISPTVHGKIQSNEAQKNQKTDQHASHPSSKGPTKEHRHVSDRLVGAPIRDRRVQFLDLHEENPPKRRFRKARMSIPILGSGAAVQCHRSNIEKSNIQHIPENSLHYLNHLPSSVCAWRGQFQVLRAAASGEVYDGFEATPPCLVNKKAHDMSNKMPSVLQLEALPASNVLTNVFSNDPPSLQDIAIYFFPSDSNERSRLSLNSIVERMNAEKSMLRSFIDGVELLLFTSSQLNEDSRGIFAAVYSEHFLWGTFRQNKIDNVIERLPDLVEPVDMDVDMIGGKDLVEPVDMDVDMIGGKDVLERMDHVQNEKLRSLSQWSVEETPLQNTTFEKVIEKTFVESPHQRTSSKKVKIEKDLITPSNEHREKVSFGISSNPPIWNPAKAKEFHKLFDIPEVPPGFNEHGHDKEKPPKYKRLDQLK